MWMWNRLMQKVSQMHTGVRLGKMALYGTMLMLLLERCAPDLALRLFAAQGPCAGGTGGSAAAAHRS